MITADQKERIRFFAQSGHKFTHAEIGSFIGCSPSTVSRILADRPSQSIKSIRLIDDKKDERVRKCWREEGEMTTADMAERFGISANAVARICKGEPRADRMLATGTGKRQVALRRR